MTETYDAASRLDWWTPEYEAATLQGIRDGQHDLEHGGIRHLRLDGIPCPTGQPYPHPHTAGCRPAPVASVPRVARESVSLADVHAVHQVVSPGCTVEPASAWTPVRDEDWGPYESELTVRLQSLPVAVHELHDAGLIRSGDPDGLVRNTVLAHLEAACEAARVDLGGYDRRVLEWLAGGEVAAAQVVVGLIRRASAAGPA